MTRSRTGAYLGIAAAFLWVVLILAATNANAAGKKPPNPAPAPTTGVAVPVRPVVLAPVATLPFGLPNGNRVNLSADLSAMMGTSTVQTGIFAPTTGATQSECQSWIEIRPAVSTLDLNVAQIGLKFGYSLAQGETGVVSGVSGNVRVNIGTLAMDIAVYQCSQQGGCHMIDSTTATHHTAGTEVSLEVDFGQITTGPSLIHNTPLGRIIRKVMDKGMAQLAASKEIHRLEWRAKVRDFDPETGMVTFDQGAQSKIATGQAFEVYGVTPSEGICDVFTVVANIRTTRVNTVSSEAQTDVARSPRGIKVGDVVMIRAD